MMDNDIIMTSYDVTYILNYTAIYFELILEAMLINAKNIVMYAKISL